MSELDGELSRLRGRVMELEKELEDVRQKLKPYEDEMIWRSHMPVRVRVTRFGERTVVVDVDDLGRLKEKCAQLEFLNGRLEAYHNRVQWMASQQPGSEAMLKDAIWRPL